jgi:RHS repeat-associated protein
MTVGGQPLTSIAQAYNGGGPVATYDYGLGLAAVIGNTGAVSYFDTDLTGNVTGISGPNGNLSNSYFYLPFGDVLHTTGMETTPFGFSGGLGASTDESGLDYMRSRFYDSNLGMFMTEDPIGIAGGTNLFNYAVNDPTNLNDPSGLKYGPIGGFDWGDPFKLSKLLTKEFGTYFRIYNKIWGPIRPFKYGIDAFVFGTKIGTFILNSHFVTSPPSVPFGSGNIQQLPGGSILSSPTTDTVNEIRPVDPNEIVGPAAFGLENFISSSKPLAYTIDFENASTASAPAQNVTITEQLDSNLDWRTFRLTGFGFDNLTYTLSGKQAFYSARLDLTGTKGYYVDVSAGVNVATGLVTWTFQTIDPNTGQTPLNPLTGFLPVNDANNDGQAFVSYTVQAKSGVQSGDVADAQATVVFDNQAPINTAIVSDTFDAVAPTSDVSPLPAQTNNTTFEVSWSGQDDSNGSGIASYTILVSEDGGPATVWLPNTTLTNALFTAQLGHVYAFSSIAADNAGNVEQQHKAPDTVIQVGQIQPPTVTMTTAGNLTNQASQTISGTVAGTAPTVGTTVSLYDNGSTTPIGTATVAADGTWSTALTLSGDGTHSIVAKDTDAAGNTGTSSPVVFTLDTIPPTVSITTTGGLTNQANQTISGKVAAGEAAVGATVTLYDNGSTTPLATATVGTGGNWSTTVTLSGDGTHSIVATDTDAAGNTGASSPVVFTLQTSPAPVANDDSYAATAGQTLVVPSPGVLANDTDANGDSLAASLVAGPSHGTLNFNSDGSFTYTPNAGFFGTDSFTYEDTASPPAGLSHWWTANGTAFDSTGNDTATLIGTTFSAGKSGQAFNFDGVDDYIGLGNNNLIGSGQDPFTLAMWIEPTRTPDGTYYLLAGLKQDTQAILEVSHNFVLGGDYIGMEFRGYNQWWIPIAPDALLNKWTQVVVVYNGGDKGLFRPPVRESHYWTMRDRRSALPA